MADSSKKRKADYESSPSGVSVEQVKTWLSGMSREDAVNLIAEMAVKNAEILSEVQELINHDPSFTKLFVRSLDWSTTDETLQALFAQYGEIQEAVVLKDNITGKSKGFGFVTFRSASSAQKALEERTKHLDGREISCHLASEKHTRPPVRSYAAPQQYAQPAYGAPHGYGAPAYGAVAPQAAWTSSPAGGRPPPGANADRRLFIRSLAWETTTESLKAHFEQFGPIVDCAVVTDRETGRSKGFGFLTFQDPQSAQNALLQPEKYIDNRLTSASLAADRDRKPTVASGLGAAGQQVAAQPIGAVPGLGNNQIQQTLHDLQQQQVNLQQRLVQQQQLQQQTLGQQPAAGVPQQQPAAYY